MKEVLVRVTHVLALVGPLLLIAAMDLSLWLVTSVLWSVSAATALAIAPTGSDGTGSDRDGSPHAVEVEDDLRRGARNLGSTSSPAPRAGPARFDGCDGDGR